MPILSIEKIIFFDAVVRWPVAFTLAVWTGGLSNRILGNRSWWCVHLIFTMYIRFYNVWWGNPLDRDCTRGTSTFRRY